MMCAHSFFMSRLFAALSIFAVLVLLAGTAGVVSAATPGFAMYKVVATSNGESQALTVNETVAVTSNPSYDNLILNLASGGQTLNYSRTVNASDDLSPFIPSISNQTISEKSGSNSLTLNVLKNGTTPLQFQGGSYTLTSYSLTGSISYNGTIVTIKGALTTFQSGLVNSASLTITYPAIQVPGIQGESANSSSFPFGTGFAPVSATQGTLNVSVSLMSTSLPLNASSPSATARVVSVGIGAGAVVSALAIGLGVRRHNKQAAHVPEDKPEHWVD